MPRTIAYWAMTAAAAAVLAWATWPGAAHNPATLISRVDLVAAVLILAGLPPVVRRKYGPGSSGWVPRLVRAGGYAIVVALIMVKAGVEQHELASRLTGTQLAGVWFGEVAFLVVITAYVAALLAVTAQRPPASPAALGIGTGAGVALGVAVYALRPLINYTPESGRWLPLVVGLAKVFAVLLLLFAAVRAAIAAARHSMRREAQRPRINALAQQGFAAGICVGISAALLVSILGITTIALAPHTAASIQWTLPDKVFAPGRGASLAPNAVSVFEGAFSRAAAGYVLVLIIFPVLGAGLGAWGGLFAEGDTGHRPGGGGGGGGPDDPGSGPTPPGGLRMPDDAGLPQLDLEGWAGGWDELAEFPELDQESPERVPVGVP
jgi:Na+-transporting methylmalonyl-CoA/oxaloacetate decarboxylase gamma subunit